ncbi:MAG: hypothetical protein JW891_08730 [Candidatus Lokiarchaeota archaeon]|nr:hypothetical protein [Candidatus Lokiarchaeota archaeon]
MESLDIANGVLGLVFIIITTISGLTIALKYIEKKNIDYLFVGIAWILFCSAWYGTSVSFIVSFFNNGEGLPIQAILLINFLPFPIGLALWIITFTKFTFVNKNWKKLFLVYNFVSLTMFYIVFITFLFIDVNQIATKNSAVDLKNENFGLAIFLLLLIIMLLITGLIFAYKTYHLDNPETKLKAIFLFLAFPSLTIGSILDAMINTTALTLVLFRILLMTSAIEFYLGFITPKWIKKRLNLNQLI